MEILNQEEVFNKYKKAISANSPDTFNDWVNKKKKLLEDPRTFMCLCFKVVRIKNKDSHAKAKDHITRINAQSIYKY